MTNIITSRALNRHLREFHPRTRPPVFPGDVVAAAGGAPTIVVAAVDATDYSLGKADFWCSGDDDRTVLQDAAYKLYDIGGAYNGGTLILTEGTFNLGGAGVDLFSNCRVIGCGKGSSAGDNEKGTHVIISPGSSVDYAFSFFGATGGEIGHMRIEGTEETGGVWEGYGISASGFGAAVYIHDINFEGLDRGVDAGFSPTIIERCHFQFCNSGVNADDEQMTVRSCTFDDNGGFDTSAITGYFGEGSFIVNNYIVGSQNAGIDITADLAQIKDNIIEIGGITGSVGIRVTAGEHNSVDDNFVSNTDGDGIVVNDSSTTCEHNTVRDNLVDMSGVLDDAVYSGIIIDADYNFITGNKVRGKPSGDQPEYGLHIAGGTGNKVTNNMLGPGTDYATGAFEDDGTATETDGGTGSGTSIANFSQAGTLTTGSGVFKLVFPVAATIVGVQLAVATSPTGANLIVDVHKNGTTIFTTQANRPIVAAADADGVGPEATPDVTSVAAGDYLTVDIDQIGSTVAGADLVVSIEYTT